eukprot:gnl/TRDRNA2_/TRDRNA2_80280_c0_seq1.p1 gnl/TRDRNA2_/TRDRNA2_80280_c0~~gnl/TRDRNA2_/TRDRNA2_80280_c0_seq1.p1  ORF type:complete len:228 (-),score=28.71 gnl/TRDRNA2_/TRDRNA2_80280_c0_seq1:214-867(-)
MSAGATYQSMYIIGFGIPMQMAVFLMGEVARHIRKHAPGGQLAVSVSAFLAVIVSICGPGLCLLLAFNLDDANRRWESWVHLMAHYLGTCVYFIGTGLSAWIYSTYVRPEAERLGLTDPRDAYWLGLCSSQLAWSTVIAAVVRVFHMTWPLYWDVPMVMAECYVIALAATFGIMGHLRLFMYLDATEPLFNTSVLPVPTDTSSTLQTIRNFKLTKAA